MKVVVSPYDPAWEAHFERHRAIIRSALSRLEPSIDHIGSTALKSIGAKPIIDILVGLPATVSLDGAVTPLLAGGYAYIQKFDAAMPYRRFFAKLENLTAGPLPAVIGDGDDFALGRDYKTSVHIHVMAKDSYHWLRHIAFRDYLLAHPDARADYHRLKQKIAVMDLADPLDYNTHKEAFIREHQDKAMAWRERRRPSAGGVRGTPPRPIG